MTWNLWWRFGPQWRDRENGILQTLREVDADIVALQEVWATGGTTQAQRLADQLGLHAAFAAPSLPPAPDPPESPEQQDVEVGLGLLARWPVRRLRIVQMPARHRTPPVTLAATLDHPAGPLHVLVACLEWEPAYADDRLAQGRALAEMSADPTLDGPLPVLVAGDLNAAPGSPVLHPLMNVLLDAWTAGGGDPAAVTLSSSHPFAPLEATELIDQRIDHVLIRPGHLGQRIVVERPRLAGYSVDGLEPSDHRAVVCEVSWVDEGPGSRPSGAGHGVQAHESDLARWRSINAPSWSLSSARQRRSQAVGSSTEPVISPHRKRPSRRDLRPVVPRAPMDERAKMRIIVDDLSGPQIAEFLAEHVEQMRSITPLESKHALDLDALRKPEVTFWSVMDGDTVVGCGALKRLDADHAELKSMRSASKRKRSGIASLLLEHILTEAKRMGFTRLSLETGADEFFRPARKLYEKFGFDHCEPFADYRPDPNSVFMTRLLKRYESDTCRSCPI